MAWRKAQKPRTFYMIVTEAYNNKIGRQEDVSIVARRKDTKLLEIQRCEHRLCTSLNGDSMRDGLAQVEWLGGPVAPHCRSKNERPGVSRGALSGSLNPAFLYTTSGCSAFAARLLRTGASTSRECQIRYCALARMLGARPNTPELQ